MKLENYNLRFKGENNRGQVLVQKEVDKSLAKEVQLQHKIEEMDSFTFELAEEVRDTDEREGPPTIMTNTPSNWHIGVSIGQRKCSRG